MILVLLSMKELFSTGRQAINTCRKCILKNPKYIKS